MKIRAESIISPIKISAFSVSSELFYASESFTFFYVQEGNIQVSFRTDSAAYLSGDLFCLQPGKDCRLTPVHESSLLLTELDPGFVLDHLQEASLLFCDSVRNPSPDYMPLRRVLLEMAALKGKDQPTAELMKTSLLYRLLALCAANTELYSSSSAKGAPARVQELAAYIDEHFQEPVTLTSLAETFYLTPQYLSSFFQKHFECSFKHYLDRKRLLHAASDLARTDLSVSEVALKNGFSSTAAFRRTFEREYHETPTAYREHRLQKGQSQASLASVEENVRTASGSAENASEHISIHIRLATDQPAHHLKKTETAVNIGSAHNLLSEAYRTRLLQFCAQHQTDCIRLMEVVSNSMVPMTLPDYDYYYQNLDTALSFLYRHRLTPIIELSRVPFQNSFAAADRNRFSYIHRNARYFRLLENILVHISMRFPDQWLKEWKFEFCIAPSDSVRSYTDDFIKIRQLLDRHLPGASLGGPGYDESVCPVGPDELLRALCALEEPPDFFSVYLHCQAEGETHSGALRRRIRSDPDHPASVCRRIRDLLDLVAPRLPLYVTEWTSVYGEDLPVTGSRFQAAFYVRTLLELERLCDLSCYWLYSSPFRSRAFADTQALLFDEGLTDSAGRPAASFYACSFCGHMGRDILSQGKNYRLVQSNAGHFQLITWNYAHFAAGADSAPLNSTDFDSVYSLFEEAPTLDFHYTLEHLPEGTYAVKREKLDEFHGSFLDILIGEFRHSNIDKSDFIQYILLSSQSESHGPEMSCMPEERMVVVHTKGTLHLQTVLYPHDLCLWDILRIV